jgi:hypothetical protein
MKTSMRHFLGKALVALALVQGLTGVGVTQDVEDLIEAHQPTTELTEEVAPSTESPPEPGEPPSARNAQWYAMTVSLYSHVAIMGPSGAIPGALAGAAGRYAANLSTEQLQMNSVANSGDQQKIQEWKTRIQNKTGIAILEGPPPSPDAGYTGDSSQWGASTWTIEQLEGLYNTLNNLPSSFRQCTKRICKFKKSDMVVETYDYDEEGNVINDPVTGQPKKIKKTTNQGGLGMVYKNMNDTVNIFDANTEGSYAKPGDGVARIRATVVHEMAHCFHYQHPEVLESWRKEFWVKVTGNKYDRGNPKPYMVDDNAVDLMGLTKIDAWEKGVTVSAYGGVRTRMEGIEPGQEDFAESTALAVCSRSRMKAGYPKRFAFTVNNIIPYDLLGDGWGVGCDTTVAEVEYNPRWFGFCENIHFKVRSQAGGKVALDPYKVEISDEAYSRSDVNLGAPPVLLGQWLNLAAY